MEQLAQAVVDTTQNAASGLATPGLAAPAVALSHEMSMWGLFMQADPVVKVVMLLLVVASIWSWAIIFEKILKMRRMRRRAHEFEDAFWSGGSLEDLYDRMGSHPADPMSSIFSSAMREWRRSAAKGLTQRSNDLRASLRDRLDQIMNLTINREMEALEKRMTFLASVGSTAPFVGLFGTVWGIMNSFQAIAASKNTSLAVVAPGIAEALFATALGLVAAIPAVVAYNKLSSDLARYSGRLEGFATEFGSILSRQLDEGR
ncbi:Cell division and transport-associated protein TolQ [Thalassobaculum litoreum DSM 18839]|uniref:Tol-Pal system protein TolQ n=2 Tax=Thalassobaculaceae TaxID=2844864 RepID=A0A8G2BEQ8_9PROT|nr:Cell division and transport-associated protein TolQ [Thalassobaculum litoreum DSM 18839]